MAGVPMTGITTSELIIPRIIMFKGQDGRGLHFDTICGVDSGFTDVLWRLICPLVESAYD